MEPFGSGQLLVVGDVAEPFLGLGAAEHARLSRVVDRIVHAAAIVNHVLEYEHLFASNVAGTAEVIRLALSGRPKAAPMRVGIPRPKRIPIQAA